MKRIVTGTGLSIFLAAGSVAAQEDTISSVRKAAIERMQAKLGGLRGAIDEEAPDIFLTENMIDRLKPIRPGDHLEAQEKYLGYVVPQKETATPDVQTVAAPKKSPVQDLYKAAGYTTDDNS